MFSTKEQLIKRTGKSGVGRYDFLKLLHTEFQTTKSKESKEQVLANLANFAYDPINYGYMRKLRIIDVFLCTLTDPNQTLVRYSISGICNLCLDPLNKTYIIQNQAIDLILSLFASQDEEILLSAITTLIFLYTPEFKSKISKPEIIQSLLPHSNGCNSRLKNLVTIFLNDYCDQSILEEVKKLKEIPSTNQ